jgi:hypothetical protein
MKPLTTIREYHYWSERLVTKLWHDNVERIPGKISMSAGFSGFGLQINQQNPLQTKAARAHDAEEILAAHIVTDFDYRGPIKYLSGRSQMLLSSLRNPNTAETGAVTLFSKLQSEEGRRIGLCLFGSADNVCGCEPAVPKWRRFGWTSSSNQGVKLLLKCAATGEDSEAPWDYWNESARETQTPHWEICFNALNICYGQGMYHGADARPWQRGYTMGHYTDVEWLAEIYFSCDDDPDGFPIEETFDTVYVGAALWVRSGTPRAWIPYNMKTIPKLDASEHPPLARPLARLRSRFRGQHLKHKRLSIEHPDWYGR